jgi:pimeloyl-ACP methyl ester carboxylesterase
LVVIINHTIVPASSFPASYTSMQTVVISCKRTHISIYCSQYYISPILCHDITLFAFDFAGCGQSEGEYISLGYYEREDVDVVFNYLRSLGTVSSIGIFGRSMGAVTALMYADRNHEIGGVVLDSPFSNL